MASHGYSGYPYVPTSILIQGTAGDCRGLQGVAFCYHACQRRRWRWVWSECRAGVIVVEFSLDVTFKQSVGAMAKESERLMQI